MHRQTLNELRLDFAINLLTPLAIPNDAIPPRFVTSQHPSENKPSLYLPASSLKGLFRRAAERVFDSNGIVYCDHLAPCSTKPNIKQSQNGATIYRAHCSACQLFGSSALRSHFTVSDAFPLEPTQTIAIRHGYEIVQNETFYGSLALRNFERWQLGLMALLMARISLADVQLGAGRSHGMGCVAVRYECLSFYYPGIDAGYHPLLQQHIYGVGSLMNTPNDYGFMQPDHHDFIDLPDSLDFDAGIGYANVVITESSDDPETGEASLSAHATIDRVLTNQAVAWGNYCQTVLNR